MRLDKGTVIPSLKVEELVFKGMGLGHHQGVPIFVFQGLPGDDIEVEIVHKRGDVYFAEIFSYNQRSPYQVPVECEVFKTCGGCEWLHLNYEDQLKFKQKIITKFFEPFLKRDTSLEEITYSPEPDFYRNKVFLPVGKSKDGRLFAGIYARRSHHPISFKRCFLQPPNSEKIIDKVVELLNKANVQVYDEKNHQGIIRYIGLRYSFSENSYIVIFVTKGGKLPFSKTIVEELKQSFPEITGIIQNINSDRGNSLLGSEQKTLYGSEYLVETIGKVVYRIHYSSFFQINSRVTHQMLNYVKANIDKGETVIDAYSGIGTIGIYIADKAEEVTCIENHPKAVKDGEENCLMNRVKNCQYILGQVEDVLENTLKKPFINTIILDPPRKGVERDVISAIVNSKLQKVIYISCDISTQKRDLELFESQGFKTVSLKPFDMFPHTYHTENVAILQRI